MKKISLIFVIALAASIQAQTLNDRFTGPADAINVSIDYPLDLKKFGLELPQVMDGKIDRILRNPKTIFYKLPRVWQHYVPACKIEHRNLTLETVRYTVSNPVWGIFRTSYLKEFNANEDFPWETTIGLNLAHKRSDNPYNTINFLSLPESHNQIIPILMLVDERPMKWIFPSGTVVGEIIYINYQEEGKKSKKYVQEIRTRVKDDSNSKWFPGIYRPIGTREELQTITGLIYEPSKKYVSLRNPEENEVLKLEGTIEKLPFLNPATVKALLSRPFKNCTLSGWHPAAMDQDFSLLPKDYTLGLLNSIDSESCANCHRQTQISVRNLIPKEPLIQDNPYKVGNIRGCDAVFTWHPFSMQSVRSDDGPVGSIIYVRAFDYRNGIVRTIKNDQMPLYPYKITAFVQESLKYYELPDEKYLHAKLAPKLAPKLAKVEPKLNLVPVLPMNSTLRWESKDRGPGIYKHLLKDGEKIIGVWDTHERKYYPYNSVTGVFGVSITSPVPIPNEILESGS